MPIDEKLEQRVAEHRGKTRQNKLHPWLIRDDGMIVPNVPLVAKKSNFRPYHGDIKASIEDRMRYLQNLGSKRRVINSAVAADEEAPFDIAKATKDDLIAFAADQYGEILDPALHLNKMRSIVANRAGVDPKAAQGGGGKSAVVPQTEE